MSAVIDQLTDYFAVVDEEQGPVQVEDLQRGNTPTSVARSLTAPDRPPAQRRWLIALASAIVVLLVVGGVAALVRLAPDDEPRRVATTLSNPDSSEPLTTTPVSTPADENIPIEPTGEADVGPTVELDWTKSNEVFEEVSSVVYTDGRFFVIGRQLLVSDDGLAWERLELDGLSTPGAMTGWWTHTDARDGKILHLVVRGGQAGVHWFDLQAGTVEISVLPFGTSGLDTDVRGVVAINRQGAAMALLFDADSDPVATAAFRSDNGVDWSRVLESGLPTGLTLALAGLGDGFAVSLDEGEPTRAFWYSPDGLEWSQLEADGPLPGALVPYGDAVLAYHESAFGPQALSANPAYVLTEEGGTILPMDLAPLVEAGSYGPVVGTGGLGIVSLSPVSDGEPETWFAEYTSDGQTWVRQLLPFSEVSWYTTSPAVGSDRVVVLANSAIWVGTRP